MDTMTHVDAAEKALNDLDLKYVSFSHDKGRYTASTYWPNGDVSRDTYCGGHANSLAEAISLMRERVAKAAAEDKVLRTAAEVKSAVIALIKEHDAAPASFRDAVDALPVKL